MEYLNKQFLLNKRPTGMPDDDCWKLSEEKITVISIDGFKNKVDIVCKNLFLLVRAFVHACVLVFK